MAWLSSLARFAALKLWARNYSKVTRRNMKLIYLELNSTMTWSPPKVTVKLIILVIIIMRMTSMVTSLTIDRWGLSNLMVNHARVVSPLLSFHRPHLILLMTRRPSLPCLQLKLLTMQVHPQAMIAEILQHSAFCVFTNFSISSWANSWPTTPSTNHFSLNLHKKYFLSLSLSFSLSLSALLHPNQDWSWLLTLHFNS